MPGLDEEIKTRKRQGDKVTSGRDATHGHGEGSAGGAALKIPPAADCPQQPQPSNKAGAGRARGGASGIGDLG